MKTRPLDVKDKQSNAFQKIIIFLRFVINNYSMEKVKSHDLGNIHLRLS